VVILLLVFGPGALVLLPIVPLVGWARVALGDHTPLQTLAGTALGGAVAASTFTLVR